MSQGTETVAAEMTPRTFGYARVSTQEQNENRQIDEIAPLLGNTGQLFIDKESGKDFDRPQYQQMKAQLHKGDKLIIKSLDRLGRNYRLIKEEWRYLQNTEVQIEVLDMPLLSTCTSEEPLVQQLIGNIVLEVLSFVTENEHQTIRKRQREGIDAAMRRGVHFGRSVVLPDNFASVYRKWRDGKISTDEAIVETNMKRSTFYKRVRELDGRDKTPPSAVAIYDQVRAEIAAMDAKAQKSKDNATADDDADIEG